MFSLQKVKSEFVGRCTELVLIGATAAFATLFMYNKISNLPGREASLDWDEDEDPVIIPLEEILVENQEQDESHIM